MRNSPVATRLVDDLSSTPHSVSTGTPRSSTASPRSSRESPSSPSSSRNLSPSPQSFKTSPIPLRNQKGQHKLLAPAILPTTTSHSTTHHSSQGLHLLHPHPHPHQHQPSHGTTQDPEGPSIPAPAPMASSAEMLRAVAAYKKLQQKIVELQHKLSLQEEKGRSDQRKIQALELVLQREAASSSPSAFASSGAVAAGGRMVESKHLAQIDALSSKLYKLEEKNQAMAEEMSSLKSDLRNKKREHETKVKEIQLKHDFDMRAKEQQQREFTSGLRKETRKDVDGLKQHLVVQETDLQKRHMREMQDLKTEQMERELQLKEIIHQLRDELEHVRQTGKRASIRRTEEVSVVSQSDDKPLTTAADAEEAVGEEEGDPEECY